MPHHKVINHQFMNPDLNETIDRTKSPDIKNMGPLSLPEADTSVLANGLTLHTLSGGDAEVSRIKILIPGGIAESPRPQLYQVANSLMLEGSKNHPGRELADIIEYNGAWTGLETTTHHSGLSMYCLNSVYPSLLPLVKEIVMYPEFAPEATAHMLQSEAARIEVEQHKVLYRAGCAIKNMVYGPQHPLSSVTDPQQLLEITPAEITEAHHARLDPEGMHVYISGLLSKRMTDMAKEVFSSIPKSRTFPLPQLRFPEHSAGQRTHVEMPDSMQSGVRLMIPAIGRKHPDYVPLRMAVIALGGYFGSRLMLNIREEKGLTYGITASLMGFLHSGFISIASQTDARTVDQLIEETNSELERMKNPASYSDDEIDRISRFVLSELAGVLDSPFSRADFLQTQVSANTPAGYFAMQDSAARTMSAEMLASMAEKYFDTSKLFIATAGK